MPAKKTRRSAVLALALLMAAAVPVRATTPPTFTVVDSIQPGSGSSYAMDASESIAIGDYLYFTADDGTRGFELWRTNGTTTELVSDIRTGGASSYPYELTVLGDYLYFAADDGTTGRELWRTNGTEVGTTRVADIRSGSADSDIAALRAFGDDLYFTANDGTNGHELWRTSGTSTMRITDINVGAGNSYPYEPTVFNGFLYFGADDGTAGFELWRTDGSTATRVADIRVGAVGSNPYDLTAFGGYLYFGADDGTDGFELWRTDGSTTTRIADINVGFGGSSPIGLTPFGDHLYFRADDGSSGNELWRTNGTALGTTRVMDINTSTSASNASNPEGFTAFNGHLYFQADDGTTGGELWRTDGSTTTQVDDINSTGSDGSWPYVFIPLGDYLYFTAYDGTASYVYRTNGTGTELVPFPDAGQRISCDCFDSHIVALGARLFSTVESAAIGHEFAYLDEPTYVLPETNRDGSVGSAWTIALSALALVTLAAGVGLRRRSGAAQR